jgi:hypothetical protein
MRCGQYEPPAFCLLDFRILSCSLVPSELPSLLTGRLEGVKTCGPVSYELFR